MPDATTSPARWLDHVDLDELLPADRNPKAHDEAVIAASVGRFGFMEAIVLDERTRKLVAGHGRTADLQRRRAAGEAPPEGVEVDADGKWHAPVMRGWSSSTDDEAHAAGIALNRSGERGGWKVDELYEMLDAWSSDPEMLVGLGFDRTDIDDLLAANEELAYDPTEHYKAEGAHGEASVADRQQQYARNGVRSFVLDYKLDAFDVLAATCARLRRARGIDTNAELIERLVLDAGKALPDDA